MHCVLRANRDTAVGDKVKKPTLRPTILLAKGGGAAAESSSEGANANPARGAKKGKRQSADILRLQRVHPRRRRSIIISVLAL